MDQVLAPSQNSRSLLSALEKKTVVRFHSDKKKVRAKLRATRRLSVHIQGLSPAKFKLTRMQSPLSSTSQTCRCEGPEAKGDVLTIKLCSATQQPLVTYGCLSHIKFKEKFHSQSRQLHVTCSAATCGWGYRVGQHEYRIFLLDGTSIEHLDVSFDEMSRVCQERLLLSLSERERYTEMLSRSPFFTVKECRC